MGRNGGVRQLGPEKEGEGGRGGEMSDGGEK